MSENNHLPRFKNNTQKSVNRLPFIRNRWKLKKHYIWEKPINTQYFFMYIYHVTWLKYGDVDGSVCSYQ